MGLSSSTDSVAGASVVEKGQGRKTGCLLHSASGAWALERGEAVAGTPPQGCCPEPPGFLLLSLPGVPTRRSSAEQ